MIPAAKAAASSGWARSGALAIQPITGNPASANSSAPSAPCSYQVCKNTLCACRLVAIGNGVPVGDLTPTRQRTFVSAETAVALFARAPRVAGKRFRRDVDTGVNQDPTPRA